ncbi:hypothetical protein PVAP13_1KG050654 [Panicum virgatum]|uniref:Uncharacterized protein n=1 Tax=Panicum virgatum TaxID=38727 RepID=A0A8T0XDH4_PANVG|nr:hypothetical protein PVAP13_1KG050654 [Panicum virgatum]KAG2657198.1 hypothetical protein PVAP13_1KG050654 [Panicum virgatum]
MPDSRRGRGSVEPLPQPIPAVATDPTASASRRRSARPPLQWRPPASWFSSASPPPSHHRLSVASFPAIVVLPRNNVNRAIASSGNPPVHLPQAPTSRHRPFPCHGGAAASTAPTMCAVDPRPQQWCRRSLATRDADLRPSGTDPQLRTPRSDAHAVDPQPVPPPALIRARRNFERPRAAARRTGSCLLWFRLLQRGQRPRQGMTP